MKAAAGLGLAPVLARSGVAAVLSLLKFSQSNDRSHMRGKFQGPVVISTWPFGEKANETAMSILSRGESCLDAVEKGINVIEADPDVRSVGYGGLPNADGVVELDAAIMSGLGHRAGSVAALQRIMHPISVARKVMELTPHVMLVGEGALRFALKNGFKKTNLLTPKSKQHWLEWKARRDSHDTIGMVALDLNGNLATGCSTSGLAWKLPGRVGDSPLIGAGLYVDNDVGGASATGFGEEILKYCASFLVVEHMRSGMAPEEACKAVLKRITTKDPKNKGVQIGLIALNKNGQWGGASIKKGFSFAVASPEMGILKEADSVLL